jgi:NAD(P)-dependent dehydrogenase (short-subunit alcohol dehydrogenase family)
VVKDLDSAVELLIVAADMTSEADGARVFKEAIAAFGTVDVLINNAGTMQHESPVATTTAATFFRDFVGPVSSMLDILEPDRDELRTPMLRGPTIWPTISSKQQMEQAQ